MEPIELKYASREFMLTKLDAMGYTGSAAAAAAQIRAPIDDNKTEAAQAARRSHLRKYELDQARNKEARDSVQRAQIAAMHGTPVAAYPQVLAENPGDIFVQPEPRVHPYFVQQAHVSAPDVARAREPWRMTVEQMNIGSIKNQSTKANQ